MSGYFIVLGTLEGWKWDVRWAGVALCLFYLVQISKRCLSLALWPFGPFGIVYLFVGSVSIYTCNLD
ncbi:hypothetical protein BJX99DRAFT_38372 [Aspergillus californicus]